MLRWTLSEDTGSQAASATGSVSTGANDAFAAFRNRLCQCVPGFGWPTRVGTKDGDPLRLGNHRESPASIRFPPDSKSRANSGIRCRNVPVA